MSATSFDTVILQPPARYEVRADALIVRASLDHSHELTRYTITVDRVAEPQDADGHRVGDPVRLPSYTVSLADVAQETVTVGETTMTLEQLALLVAKAVDMLKGRGLSESPPT